jgi:hypothetical protein
MSHAHHIESILAQANLESWATECDNNYLEWYRLKAAYWDGRSNAGEPISSGVYFYHLKAGEYSAVKRMVVVR